MMEYEYEIDPRYVLETSRWYLSSMRLSFTLDQFLICYNSSRTVPGVYKANQDQLS